MLAHLGEGHSQRLSQGREGGLLQLEVFLEETLREHRQLALPTVGVINPLLQRPIDDV